MLDSGIAVSRFKIVQRPARQAHVLKGFRQAVVRLTAGQVAVIVALVNQRIPRRCIHCPPAIPPGLIDHPVVPTGAADGKIG